MINKIIEKIKKYQPPKHICFLYFFVPIFVSTILNIDRENDIWFLLNHGKYVLQNGFPTIEPFSMHQGFSFVMQQWLSAVIFYLVYNFLGKYGLFLLMIFVNILILFLLYKLCMKLSDNRFRLSVIISSITTILLEIFLLPRPQIFTYVNLISVLYIMESVYRNKSSKLVYLLPLISLLQINLHASLWFLLFLFMLPYIIYFIIAKIKDKKSYHLSKLFIIIIVMFLVGFINPYGIKNISYVFTSYGDFYINNMVIEMFSPFRMLGINNFAFYYVYLILFFTIAIYIVNKKGELFLPHMLLFIGVSYLAITSLRNAALLIIGTIPFLAWYLKNLFPKTKEKKAVLNSKSKIQYISIIIFLLIYNIVVVSVKGVSFTNPLEKGIDYLLKYNDVEDIILYTSYNDGSYAEYRGLKPYMDTRAEIFLKANNHKADIMKEYFLVQKKEISCQEFLDKYHFTHLIINQNDSLYDELLKNSNYKVIYKGKYRKGYYKIFELIK